MRNKTHLFEYISAQMCMHTIKRAQGTFIYSSIDSESTIERIRGMDRKRYLNAQCTDYFVP